MCESAYNYALDRNFKYTSYDRNTPTLEDSKLTLTTSQLVIDGLQVQVLEKEIYGG